MTIYRIKIANEEIEVDLHEQNPDGTLLVVERENGELMLGVDLHHGEVVAGYWPDGEEWVDEIHVPNPQGDTVPEGLVIGGRSVIIRHPAQDDMLAVARAVGVTED